jgi:hypothetical protein
MTPTPAAAWIRSSYSAAQNECVEVRPATHRIDVRDSKEVRMPHLRLTPAAFMAFVAAVQREEL